MTDEAAEAGAGGGQYLPPIHRVVEPPMQHMSTRIRWFLALGYKVKEVAAFLGVRYQMVRNVSVTIPKRAAREDLPELKVEVAELDDDVEAMDKRAMELEMQAQRGQHLKERLATNAGRRRLRSQTGGADGEGEDDFGNEELDDENYGR